MRISGPFIDGVDPRPSGRSSGKVDSEAASSADGVNVSASARQLSGISAKSSAARAEHIARLKQQVDAGSYVADRGRVADRLADEELARAGRR